MSFIRVCCLLLLALASPPLLSVDIGQKAPNIIGKYVTSSDSSQIGKWFRLSKDLRNQPALVNFFWVECEPCIVELPHLADLEQRFPNVAFYSVHVEKEDIAVIENFLAGLSGHPRNMIASSAAVQSAYSPYGPKQKLPLPYTVIIDNSGRLLYQSTGYNAQTIASLEKALFSIQ